MIFHSLELTNFRQFADTQVLKFATDSAKNVTVIHGFNGAGKTTLLNAFTWLFYGQFSADFADSEVLCNEATWARLPVGESLKVSVKAEFEHGGRRYVAERHRDVRKLTDGAREVKSEGELKVVYIDGSGVAQTVGGPQDHLEQILPVALFPFFFFNGERIERLASPKAYEEVQTGVKVLLDIELLERAIKHLDRKISDDLRREIANHSGVEGKAARDERDKLFEKRLELERELEQHRNNQAALLDQRETIDSKLRAMPEVAKLQTQREEKEKQLKDIQNQLVQAKQLLAKAFSRNAYLALVPNTLRQARVVLEDAHQKGQLPTPLKRQFVDELLHQQSCICGRALKPGESAYEHVHSWRNRSGSVEIEQAATATLAELRNLDSRADDFVSEADRLQRLRADLNQRQRYLQEELSEISSRIGTHDSREEDHQRLEARRTQIDHELDSIKFAIHTKMQNVKTLEEAIKQKDVAIRSLEKADAKGQLAQRRLDAVQNVVGALKAILALKDSVLRRDISQILSDIWSEISVKDYHAELDDSYRLRLTKDIGGVREPVRGASTGEKQVLSLAFVSALVRKARESYDQHQKSDGGNNFFTGGLYPLVMDSPFGSLEVDYRRQVARSVPRLAPQIIVLVSESQWRREVEEELQSRIGNECVLNLQTTKHMDKSIDLRGRSYPYVTLSPDGFERTTIVEVQL